ncbi:MAG: hypothetical protein QS98_C0014G0027 [archaeon GW2011_AR3]|nr:MAG: hypothetical protein QS98_C0014G0027 [archaeon GW2011_AR3]MBS3109252.1 hypothetical protein [Candidatus Woesearchaeota archaeon]
MFFRIKRINGKEYAYIVKNKWTQNGCRQKVVGYAGRVFKPDKLREITFEDFIAKILKKNHSEYLQKMDFDEAIMDLAKWQLYVHGAEISGDMAQFAEFFVTLAGNNVLAGKKNVALKMNEGYFCTRNLKAIMAAGIRESEDDLGSDFAHSLVNAGLIVPKDVFVKLYEKLS